MSIHASLKGARSQGATEYLLVLVVVLIVVAVAVFFLSTTRPPAISITGTAVKGGDNINFTPSTTMTPASIPDTDWEYAVYQDATVVRSWTPGPADLQRGVPVALVATGNQIGDLLKIRYKGVVFDTLIS